MSEQKNHRLESQSDWIQAALNSPDLQNRLNEMEPEAVAAIAEAVAAYRPLQPYPSWHFNIDWNNPDPQIQLRREIWQYVKTKHLTISIQFHWYFDLFLNLYLGNDLSSQLFISGCYEPNELYFLSQILQPGMTLIDVGANDGLYALMAAKLVGTNGSVLAFEPSRREFHHLQSNISLNQLEYIQAFPIALADVNGQATLKLANYEHAGQNTLGEFIYDGVASSEVETVELKRLDDFVETFNLQQIDVIKMDVEGAEFAVLQGAQHMLATYHPLLLLELSDSALQGQGSSADAVLEFLRSLGYEIFTFGQRTGLPIRVSGQFTSNNIVAAHPDRTWIGFTEADKMDAAQLELAASQAEIARLQQTLEQTQTQLQETQVETEQLQANLQQTQANLQQTQADLQHVSFSYEQANTEMQQVHAELGKAQAELIEIHERLHQAELGLFAAQAEWQKSREQIAAMESSKFWQLRNKWMQFRRNLNLPTTD